MVRKFGVAALGLVAFAFAVSGLNAADEEKKPATIEDCMKFQGRNGLATKINADAKAGKWADAKTKAADLAFLGTSLGKNTPPKNADKKDAWEKVTKAFAEKTAAVETAVKAEKAADVNKAVTALLDKANCMGCHSQFKGN